MNAADLRSFAKGVGIFMLFYAFAWTGWFAVLTGGDFAQLFDHFQRGWSFGARGLPLLIQVFALGTAIFSTWALYALERLDWF